MRRVAVLTFALALALSSEVLAVGPMCGVSGGALWSSGSDKGKSMDGPMLSARGICGLAIGSGAIALDGAVGFGDSPAWRVGLVGSYWYGDSFRALLDIGFSFNHASGNGDLGSVIGMGLGAMVGRQWIGLEGTIATPLFESKRREQPLMASVGLGVRFF